MIFYSNRTFKIWAYTTSHQSLLLRSYLQLCDENGYSDETSYNIDLEFSGVEYMDMITTINSLSLSIIEKGNLPDDLKKDNVFRGKVFEILSENKRNLIIADNLIIGTNRLIYEDRIFNYDLDLNHDNIILCVPH